MHRDMEAAKLLHHLVHHSLHNCRLCGVAGKPVQGDTCLRGQLLRFVYAPVGQYADLGTALRQQHGGIKSNAA